MILKNYLFNVSPSDKEYRFKMWFGLGIKCQPWLLLLKPFSRSLEQKLKSLMQYINSFWYKDVNKWTLIDSQYFIGIIIGQTPHGNFPDFLQN